MDYQGILKNRRSIRDYQDRQVPLDIIREILQETTLAPTASNGQPCQFIIIQDKALMKRLSDDSKANLLAFIEANPGTRLATYAAALNNPDFNVFYNAPCLVLMVGPTALELLSVDTALTAAYLMFAATSRGLGTCWINLGARINDPGLLETIGLPTDCRIVAPIILGYPTAIPAASERHAPEIIKVIG